MEAVGEPLFENSTSLFCRENLAFITMNGVIHQSVTCRLVSLAALLLSVVYLKADPVVIGEGLIFGYRTLSNLTLALLAEAVCVLLILRRRRTPRLFILWLMGMHLFTYPLFLGLLWLADGMRPPLVVGMGEGLIVAIEGILIYLICRFAPYRRPALPAPSVSKSLLASLAGNLCSAVAYPLLVIYRPY